MAKKQNNKPKALSAAAAKRKPNRKKVFDLRSIYITGKVEPKTISGGAMSLGKHK